jgi:hypothetical protein
VGVRVQRGGLPKASVEYSLVLALGNGRKNGMPATIETWKEATSVPGLSPLREDDMTVPAIDAWAKWWRGRNDPDFIAREIVAPHGIADLVAIQFDRAALEGRAEAGIRPTNDLAALRVILACRRVPRSVSDLVDILCLSPSTVRRAIRIGCDTGALTDSGGRQFKTKLAWDNLARRIVAVELKRTDWQRAIRQLWAYQEWASATWLVLGQRPPITALEALHGCDVGLGYLDEDAEMRVLLRPKTRRRLTGLFSIWAAEQALAHALTNGYHPYKGLEIRSDCAKWKGALALIGG